MKSISFRPLPKALKWDRRVKKLKKTMTDNIDRSRLDGSEKKKLLSKLLNKRKSSDLEDSATVTALVPNLSIKEGIKEFKKSFGLLKILRLKNPYFRTFDGLMKPILRYEDQDVINFSGYDYLSLASDLRVHEAAIDAIHKLGTSVGASRLASGERPLHQELEKEFADFMGCEDALVFVGGYATNEGVIGHIAGPGDVIIHDELMHRSAIDGAQLSRADRLWFAHNDMAALEEILIQSRKKYRQCFILVEGIYSMDGDLPELKKVIELKKKYDCFLFVDEAHSLGVLGETGRGIGEHFGTQPSDVDLWMGTLSKSFASCGGVLAGSKELITYLRYTTPAFIYSVGIPPSNAAAALRALKLTKAEPERVKQAQEAGRYFFDLLNSAGLNTGISDGFNIVPLIVGDTKKSVQLTNALLEEGVNAQAIFHPVVPESESRLRFFVTAGHTKEILDKSGEIIKKLYNKIC
jgi:8-amino-7-oxononanoate synthase